MLPREIMTLGFNFFGGDIEGCLFLEHPTSLEETARIIKEARELLHSSNSEYADMIMRNKEGKQELVKLYSDQKKRVTKPIEKVVVTSDVYDEYADYNYQ